MLSENGNTSEINVVYRLQRCSAPKVMGIPLSVSIAGTGGGIELHSFT